MRNLLLWIPEFLRGMLEVMKETQERAGGGWKGQLVFWLAVVWVLILSALFFTWFSKYAYNNFTDFLSYFNITVTHVNIEIPSSFFTNLWIAIGFSVLYMVILVGFASIIGAFWGMLLSFIFRQYTTFRVDKIIAELRPILENADRIDATGEVERILNDFNEVETRWFKSKFNRITRRLTSKHNRDMWTKEREKVK